MVRIVNMISQSYCIEMCSAFGSVTSAHAYLPPFFLLFNHIPNDYNFSETRNYLFLSLKCQQQVSLLLIAPFPK